MQHSGQRKCNIIHLTLLIHNHHIMLILISTKCIMLSANIGDYLVKYSSIQKKVVLNYKT